MVKEMEEGKEDRDQSTKCSGAYICTYIADMLRICWLGGAARGEGVRGEEDGRRDVGGRREKGERGHRNTKKDVPIHMLTHTHPCSHMITCRK